MIFLKNCAIGHIPKCAGRFVRMSLKRCVYSITQDIPNDHYAHLTPDVEPDKGVAFFVRDPYRWLRSLYAHRARKCWNWDTRYELEAKCKHQDFSSFVGNVVKHENILYDYFETYLGKYRDHDLRIGKVENVYGDLVDILTHFDEEFDRDKIYTMELHGDNPRAQSLSISPKLSEELRASQAKFYEEYDY